MTEPRRNGRDDTSTTAHPQPMRRPAWAIQARDRAALFALGSWMDTLHFEPNGRHPIALPPCSVESASRRLDLSCAARAVFGEMRWWGLTGQAV